VKKFSSLIAPITEVLKSKRFEWNDQAHKAFEIIKEKITSTSILALLNFAKVFEVKCGASGVGIEAVPMQEGSTLLTLARR